MGTEMSDNKPSFFQSDKSCPKFYNKDRFIYNKNNKFMALN
jgi:hypothetical protein